MIQAGTRHVLPPSCCISVTASSQVVVVPSSHHGHHVVLVMVSSSRRGHCHHVVHIVYPLSHLRCALLRPVAPLSLCRGPRIPSLHPLPPCCAALIASWTLCRRLHHVVLIATWSSQCHQALAAHRHIVVVMSQRRSCVVVVPRSPG